MKVVPFDESDTLTGAKYDKKHPNKETTCLKAVRISSMIIFGLLIIAAAVLLIIAAVGRDLFFKLL